MCVKLFFRFQCEQYFSFAMNCHSSFIIELLFSMLKYIEMHVIHLDNGIRQYKIKDVAGCENDLVSNSSF